jgi:uncharacterized protein
MTTIVQSFPKSGISRVSSIDSLRGFALLGILLMNIIGFAFPFASYLNPVFDSSTAGINFFVYGFMDVFAEGAMRTIFSMLFGAGLLLFMAKDDASDEQIKGLYYRRMLLLIGFGMVDAYLFLWLGDILFVYGVAGLILYFFRNLSPAKLIASGVFLLCCLTVLHSVSHIEARRLTEQVRLVQALPPQVIKTDDQVEVLAQWKVFLSDQFLTQAQIDEEISQRQSGYSKLLISQAPIALMLQTWGLVFGSLWDALAMMLLGMAMMKWQVFNAEFSFRFYGLLCGVGLAVGIAVNLYEVVQLKASDFEIYWSGSFRPSYEVGRLAMALGYIGAVMLICKLQVLGSTRLALAAVGRMALTNYLSQSVICNTIFMGFGWGLVAELERSEIYIIVVGIWAFQLILSSLVLRRFRYGPVEWLWRSLTYGKKQPFRV